MALGMSDEEYEKANPDLNPGERDYNEKFTDLNNAEKNGNIETNENQSTQKNNENDLKGAEEKPNNGWTNNFSGKQNSKNKTNGRFSSFKKKGPLTAIILTMVCGGIGFGGLLSTAALPMAVLANLVNKFNTGETSLTIRANKVMASKISSETTSGSCNIIKIACRFSKPSNRFLTQLEKNGVKALDSSGNVIEKNVIFPNTRPASYKFTNNAGESIEVEAKNFYSTLAKNSEFRAAFHSASQTRFMSLMDSVASSIKIRFGFSSANKLSGVKDESSLTSELDNSVKVDDSAIKSAANTEGKTAAAVIEEEKGAVKELIEEEVDASIGKVTKAGKGSVIGLASGVVCMVTDIPGLIVSVNRNFQMVQLIRYSASFLSAFGAIKAGDATPQEVSAIGDMLTKTVNGKSAMDSFGMSYVMTDQKIPNNNNYRKFSPGSSIVTALSSVTKVTNSVEKKAACNVMMNPVTGEAINIGLAANSVDTLGVSLVAAVANLALGAALSYVIEKVAPPAVELAMNVIPINSILQLFIGDLTKDISGESVGDAITSGASHIMGQTANAGGNMPLTVAQAVAYDNTTKQIQLAYAEEDRATKSPFDISSQNTMLGSIMQSLLPYYAKLKFNTGSVTSNLATIGNMITKSFGIAMQPLIAGATSIDSSQYQLCDDPSIKDNDVAAGPYCNIIYGIPPEYLDEDPIAIINKLIASGDIDEETGEPKDKGNDAFGVAKESLKSWMELCTDGKTNEASNCKINDKTRAEYALYTVDHRIQKSMDEATQ